MMMNTTYDFQICCFQLYVQSMTRSADKILLQQLSKHGYCRSGKRRQSRQTLLLNASLFWRDVSEQKTECSRSWKLTVKQTLKNTKPLLTNPEILLLSICEMALTFMILDLQGVGAVLGPRLNVCSANESATKTNAN